jgi:hypothetical protein
MNDEDVLTIAYRRIVEARLSDLLDKAQTGLKADAIQSLVFDYHHTRSDAYAAQMLSLFASSKSPLDDDEVISVTRDAWNYFPHRSLMGRCPAELLGDMDH